MIVIITYAHIRDDAVSLPHKTFYGADWDNTPPSRMRSRMAKARGFQAHRIQVKRKEDRSGCTARDFECINDTINPGSRISYNLPYATMRKAEPQMPFFCPTRRCVRGCGMVVHKARDKAADAKETACLSHIYHR